VAYENSFAFCGGNICQSCLHFGSSENHAQSHLHNHSCTDVERLTLQNHHPAKRSAKARMVYNKDVPRAGIGWAVGTRNRVTLQHPTSGKDIDKTMMLMSMNGLVKTSRAHTIPYPVNFFMNSIVAFYDLRTHMYVPSQVPLSNPMHDRSSQLSPEKSRRRAIR